MNDHRYGIGAPLRRKEDQPLLTGKGRFLGDILPDNCLHAAIMRAPVAHARFRLGNLEKVRAMPGVRAVITGTDVTALGDLPCIGQVANSDGSRLAVPPYPVLPTDTIRHVGEALAMVVADTLDQASLAAEAIGFDADELVPVVDLDSAMDAPAIWPQFKSNLAFDIEEGNRDETASAFKHAAHTIELRLVNNRVVTNYLEPRGALGEYDAQSGRYTLTAGTQGVHLVQPILAKRILKVSPDALRVVTPDVGGGFGTRYFTYREYALVCHAAKLTGRPVAWLGTRSEHFLADYHGRDNISRAALALDGDLNFLGIKVDTLANMGAYLGQMAPFIPALGIGMVPGIYRTPAIHVRARGIYTNTVPVDAYRGAGRPEAAYLIERLVSKAALELGVAQDELRRRNWITPVEMPFTTPTKRVYDSGDFASHLDAAMMQANWPGFAARRRQSAEAGRLRGIGMATYIEACSGGLSEFGQVVLDDEGGATIYVGTQSTGQGHHTAYAQLAAEHLGIDPQHITVVQGDTDRVARGAGSGGSRSIPVGGTSIYKAAERLAGRLKQAAADHLEAASADIELVDGAARIAGTDRSVALKTLIAALDEAEREAHEDWQPSAATFPNGTHIAEVEIDPETGSVRIAQYDVVDDFGIVLNPLLLQGQIHGGLVQGMGQALHERTVHDENGQLLTGSFMDYCMPRADQVPPIRFNTRNVPCRTNVLGIKGAGEAGAIGSCPAIINAVCDALHDAYGISHIDMPVTPERLWQTIAGARKAQAGLD